MSCSICGTARRSSRSRQPARCPTCAMRCRNASLWLPSKCAWYFIVSKTTVAPSARAPASAHLPRPRPKSSGAAARGGLMMRVTTPSGGRKGSSRLCVRPISWKSGSTTMDPRKTLWNMPWYFGLLRTSRRSPMSGITFTFSNAGSSGGQSFFFGARRLRPACCSPPALAAPLLSLLAGLLSVTSSTLPAARISSSGDAYGYTCSAGFSGGKW
mmetsp:Transcript_43447/g.122925  ORF Transcript_43447/g.122925 Transcript_43447/m.122925 type:complete len:213 (-) Transcript_43447:1225-1863(-)